jgi:putative transposase
MPRTARIRVAGIPWHVVQRGHARAACFFEPADYHFYLALLEKLSPQCGCDVHAYVLMTNHVHLLVTPSEVDGVSRLMKRLGEEVARRQNRVLQRSGSFFEGRFRSSLVETGFYLFCCYRYIELNPVRAGNVTHPRDYAWSSYRTNAEGVRSRIVTPHTEYAGLAASDEERRSAYRELFGSPLRDSELAFLRQRSNRGTPIGGDAFHDQMVRLSGAA